MLKKLTEMTWLDITRRKSTSLNLIFIGAALVPLLCSAQENELSEKTIFENYFEKWYQVELIVFERIEQTSEDPEAWPKNIELGYPLKLAFLTDALAVKDDAEESSQATDPQANRDLLETLKRGSVLDPLNKKLLSRIEQAELARLTPDELPFVFLSDEQKQLTNEKRTLDRDRAMRVLFHQAWRQPMLDRNEAPSIVMTGGDLFDNHYELEGTIKLFVSRYLHIHTDLWLARFEANVGQDTGHWPQIPLRPEPFRFTDENVPPRDGLLTDQDISANIDSLSLDNDNNGNREMNIEVENDSPTKNSDIRFFDTLDSPSYETSYQTEFSPYLATHIVTLRQKRRMRSDELHYIDHPKLGILIKITRYEPEFTGEEDGQI